MAERAGAVKSILIRPAVRVFDPILRCLMLMAAVAPLAVTQNVIQLDHDDAWYLHRAVCFSRSFYDLSAFGIYTCMRSMFKSPTAGLLLLPTGPLKHDMVEPGAAPFVLACLTFGLGICVAWITLRAEVPLLGVAAAAVAIRLCGPIETADAPFLLDGAFRPAGRRYPPPAASRIGTGSCAARGSCSRLFLGRDRRRRHLDQGDICDVRNMRGTVNSLGVISAHRRVGHPA